MNQRIVKNIPLNIITGFLGVGKTTAIRYLLKHKPAAEHWAVLVNEMGEVGIDGALLQQDGIAVKQVAGGCMCCVSGLPSKVALNQLIRQQRPDRILVEPSGIAHPRKILETYGGRDYAGVLDLHAVICLVDPWSLTQPRIRALPTFNDQIALADVLIASKADSTDPEHLALFKTFAAALQPPKSRVEIMSQGELQPAWLDTERMSFAGTLQPLIVAGHQQSEGTPHPAEALPEADSDGVIRLENRTAEAFSCGWIFPATWQFRLTELQAWLAQIEVPRIKGVIQTEAGWYSINRMRTTFSSEPVEQPESGDSRLEMISMSAVDWRALDDKVRGFQV